MLGQPVYSRKDNNLLLVCQRLPYHQMLCRQNRYIIGNRKSLFMIWEQSQTLKEQGTYKILCLTSVLD
jgi:hypothetical protein